MSCDDTACKCDDAKLVPAPKVFTAPKHMLNQIPDDILNDNKLNEAISYLPPNYNFEVHKSVWQLRKYGAKRVALQLPEGLIRYGTALSDIFRIHAGGVQTVLLGEVTYGACCIDDVTAAQLGCDFLIHYGHSCLIPVTECLSSIRILYVFVEIRIGAGEDHLERVIRDNFAREERIAMMGTIQFINTVHTVKKRLESDYTGLMVPQAKPLSPGETLGCTAPRFPDDVTSLIFVADGRFHLEAAMIANPQVAAYRYDPYSRIMTREHYDHADMHQVRREAIEQAAKATRWGILVSTLGRQGSPAILTQCQRVLRDRGCQFIVLLMPEIRPEKLASLHPTIQAWVQVACPRLSIDWGTYFAGKPLLSPYELHVMHGIAKPFWESGIYPMDFYDRQGAGPWTVYPATRQAKAENKVA